jgi:ParB family chromosome partitioning protein
VRDIPIGDIRIKENIRQEYTEIEDLASSIKQHGLLQPITVYSDGDRFVVKTGHRRFMAYHKLYEEDSERFHSIRCIVSDSENIAVIQLIENVQRTDLAQIDLYNALAALRDQGMTLKQIAEGMGKTEKYIKNLFVGINEISNNERLQEFIGSPAGGTIQDIAETKGIPDETDRLNLLEQRKNGHITRSEMREKVRKLKGSPKPAKDKEHDKKAILPQKKK